MKVELIADQIKITALPSLHTCLVSLDIDIENIVAQMNDDDINIVLTQLDIPLSAYNGWEN